jgi:type I restriction enzyme S subunit
MVYNEELKRDIPAGWGAGSFADIGDIVGGTTPSKKNDNNFTKSGTPWITPKDLSGNVGNKFITRGEWDVTEEGIKDGSLRILPKGTVLLSSRAPIGYLAVSRTDVTTNQGFKSLIPIGEFTTEFVFYTVQLYIPTMIKYASGSTFQEISGGTLKMIKIVVPNSEVVKSYTNQVESLFKQQDVLEMQNEKLESLRDWLLPMLMNGQVRVKE